MAAFSIEVTQVALGAGAGDLLLADRVGPHRLFETVEIGLGAAQIGLGRLQPGRGPVTLRLIGLGLDLEEQLPPADKRARLEGQVA